MLRVLLKRWWCPHGQQRGVARVRYLDDDDDDDDDDDE
jgi:hypothetical protein